LSTLSSIFCNFGSPTYSEGFFISGVGVAITTGVGVGIIFTLLLIVFTKETTNVATKQTIITIMAINKTFFNLGSKELNIGIDLIFVIISPSFSLRFTDFN